MSLPDDVTQADLDLAAGSDEFVCDSCGGLAEGPPPDPDEILLCDVCEEVLMKCELCSEPLQPSDAFVCPNCERLVCASEVVQDEVLEDLVCRDCSLEQVDQG